MTALIKSYPLKTTCIFGMGLLVVFGIAAKIVTFDQQLLGEADKQFAALHYPEAIKIYRQICGSYPGSQSARIAQYQLGVANIYYNNPQADWQAARREFITFQKLYPDDERIGIVNSWLRIIASMKSYQDQYNQKSSRLKAIENRPVVSKAVFDSMQTCFQRSELEKMAIFAEKDSLAKRIESLEQLILKLENIDKSR